jgi:Heparinase II/III-like protein/Heparinase II/III N-terminus
VGSPCNIGEGSTRAQELPLVLLFEVKPVSDADRENLAADRYTVRGEEIDLVRPIDWQMDPHDNQSWRFWFHTLQFLDVPLRVYEDEGDLDALAKARDIALDWVSGNPIGGERTGDFAWYDMGTGVRAAFLGYVWRETRRNGLLDPEQETDLTAALRLHARWLSDEKNYTPHSNHGLFEDAGLYVMGAYAGELPDAAGWRDLAERRFLETLSRHIEFDEGVHKEHSPGYQMYIRDLVKQLREQGGIGGDRIAGLLERLDAAAGWMVMPDGTMSPFGDTDMIEAPAFAREAADQEGLRVFFEAGYAFVRRGSSYLALTCCHHSRAHKHADELSWCLHEGDHLIVGEASRFGYRDEKDPARIYARSSHGHNVLIVDDQSFPWPDHNPYGSGLLAAGEGGGWYAILGRNPLLDGVDHRRLLLYRPGELVVVADELESKAEHTIDRRLHFGPELVAAVSGSEVVARADGNPVAALFEASEVPVEVTLARGEVEPRMDGWTFPRDNTKVPSDAVTLRTRLASGTLVHGVAVGRGAPDAVTVKVEEGLVIVEISRDGNRERLRVSRSDRELDVVSAPVPA